MPLQCCFETCHMIPDDAYRCYSPFWNANSLSTLRNMYKILVLLCQGNFLAAEYGAPNWSSELESQYDNFCNALLLVNPDFQIDPEKNYPRDGPGEANMSICASQVTARFACFAATLEQPFIDTEAEYPQPKTGWSPERSVLLGRSLLQGFAALL